MDELFLWRKSEMDIETRKSVFEMRSQGIGIQSIAKTLGINSESLKEFCKRYHLMGPSEVVKLNIIEQERQHIICPECRKKITRKKRGRTKRFCSEVCRRTWWEKHGSQKLKQSSAIYHFECLGCGRAFSAYGNQNRKYCCHRCYINHRYRRESNGI